MQGTSSPSSNPQPALAQAAQSSSMTPALAAHAKEVLLQLQALSEQVAVPTSAPVAVARSGAAAFGAAPTPQPQVPAAPQSLWTLLPKLAQTVQAVVVHQSLPLRPSEAVGRSVPVPAAASSPSKQQGAVREHPRPCNTMQPCASARKHPPCGTVRMSNSVQVVSIAHRQSRISFRASAGSKRSRNKLGGHRSPSKVAMSLSSGQLARARAAAITSASKQLVMPSASPASVSQPTSPASSGSDSHRNVVRAFSASASQPPSDGSPASPRMSLDQPATPAPAARDGATSASVSDTSHTSATSGDAARTAVSSLTSAASQRCTPEQLPLRPARQPAPSTSCAAHSLGVTPRVSILASTGQSTSAVPPELPSMTTMNLPPLHSSPAIHAALSAPPPGSSPSRGWLSSMLGVLGARVP